MSVKIRQEISITTAAVPPSTSYIVQLDTTQYVNPTYYFEAVVKDSGTTRNVTLRRNGTATDDATITTTGATFARIRSTAFTPPVGQTEYIVSTSGLGVTANTTKIIVIDNPTTLTSTETQIEIGMTKTGLVSTTATKVVPDTTLTKYWLYTAAKWDGTTTFYAEVTYLMASSKSSGTFVLQEDNGSFASWTDKVTIVNAGVATVGTRVRSASFTPTDGRNYRIAYLVASSKSAASIFNAKIIVDQTIPTNLQETGATPNSIAGGGEKVFGGTAASGQVAQAQGLLYTAAVSYSLTAIELSLDKQGTPSDNYYYEIHNASPTGTLLGTSAKGTISTLTGTSAYSRLIFTPAVAISSGSIYAILLFRDGFTSTQDSTNYVEMAFLTSSGSTIRRRDNLSWAQPGTGDGVFKTYGDTSSITLLEPQYLLLNTADNNVAGDQSYPTLYDTAEWSGVTNTYKHAMDSDNALNAAKIEDTTTTTVLTTSAVTGANQQISSDMASQLVSTDTLDTDVVTSTGVIAASRILVGVTVSSAVNATVTQVAGTVTAAGGTQTVSTALNATVTQLAATVTAAGGTQTIATVNIVAISQVAGTVTAAGGTQVIATVNKVAISQLAGTVTASGGTQVIATVNNVSIAQLAGTVTASGGSQVIATSNFVALSQLAATVTAAGGTQLAQTNSLNAQIAATVTATGGTQTIATSNFVSLAQVAGVVPASGGTQTIATVNNVSITQVAGSVTATGGTQSLATVNSVAISQLAGTVTTTGGSQGVNSIQDATVTQLAGTVTASGGTQVVVTLQTVAITQVAANVTAAGGTQLVMTNSLIAQSGASVTASGGTQAIATVNNVSVAQLAATVTASGGTQTLATVNDVSITQVAGIVTASGGTQAVNTMNFSTVSQLAGSVTASGGTQSITAFIDAAIAQLAANVTTTGGVQDIFTSSGATSIDIAQLAASLTATGGTQVISTSTGPLPPTKSPSTIFLTDGHLAVKLGGNLFMPL